MIFLLCIPALVMLAVAAANVVAWPRLRASSRRVTPRAVSVLIPARDEEANIAACLDGALRQTDSVGEVLVYDDHSTDRTAQIVREAAARDARVRLLEARPLPSGWCGKTFACAQLANAASGDWLLFIDADARLADSAANALVTTAIERKITFLSAWPGLVMMTFWERALMPLLNYVVFTLFPAPLSLKRDDRSLGLAHGACILAHRETYLRTGGHVMVRDEIFEDTQLAKRWRASGERGLCLDGQAFVWVRMYASLDEIWRGFQKNFYPAFRRPLSFWAFIALHAILLIAPLLLLIAGHRLLFIAATALIFATRLLLALRFNHPAWSVLLHPLATLVMIAIGLSSWRRCQSGRGVEWKGREYRTRRKQEAEV
jgi:glycosyltransferase involved in cell wall biosynthesis